MSRKRFSLPFLIALLALLILAVSLLVSQPTAKASVIPAASPAGTRPPPASSEALVEVEEAIRQALDQNREAALVTIIYETGIENARLSADGQWGRAHLVPLDPESGEFVTSEPGLALTLRQADGSWDALLPADTRWEQAIKAAPPDLISAEEKTVWLQMYAQATAEVNAGEPFSGYYLPWAKGLTIGLSRSILHYNPPDHTRDMHYSFDFYYPTQWDNHDLRMFDLHASRPGVVWLWRDIVPTCYDYTCTDDPDHEPLGNYIVIKDDSTDPDTYQLYLHLAQDSIPDELKVKGTPVGQGQFIGKVDNTGQSWGHHLHFQVHTNQWSYWGHAQDILFNEVTINGGRPRTQYEATKYPMYGSEWVSTPYGPNLFTSQNPPPGDGVPPVGDILTPLTGQVYTDTVYLQGWAIDDDPGLQSAQFLAFYQGFWWPVGPEFNTILFDYTWDWCAASVPDGPVSLALRLVDKGGVRTVDLPGLRHVLKAGGCQPQPPACQPTAGQAAIFAEPNYAGACQLFATGIYTDTYSFGAVGNDNTASLLLGPGTAVTLYSDANLQGRSESFHQSDPNLAENRIGSDTLSSLQVFTTTLPAAPGPQWPLEGQNFTNRDSIDLLGMDLGAGRQFRLELTGPGPGPVMSTTWQGAPFWPLGNLLAGNYSWRLQAQNPAGDSAWSVAHNFTVSSDPATPPAAVNVPFNDDLEGDTSDWATSGSWAISTSEKRSGSQSFRYSYPAIPTGQAHFGDLTSRPINLPVSANPYYLTFWYRYETESFYPHWDQRRVQVSLDGQPFQDVYQLVYDPDMNESGMWMQAVIDLSPYYDPANAHQLRLRFHFHSLDGTAESFRGWYLDDINLSASPPPACADAQEPNDSPAAATPLSYGDTVQAQICPQGDYDFYTFNGQAGERIGVNVDAKSIGSSLDSILYLLDADGSSALAVNDDEVQFVQQDPLLNFQLPYTGTYYLRLQAWNHPKGSGAYSLTLNSDASNPSVTLVGLSSGGYLPGAPFDLQATASDSGSGLDRVEFWWHDPDWLGSDWQLLATDRDGSDGWATPFDPTGLGNVEGLAILAAAYDRVGNPAFAAAWDLRTDLTPPSVNIDSLPNPVDTTALHLQWSASDGRSGLARVDLDVNVNNGGWNALYPDTTAAGAQWYIGQAGNSYAFRASASDQAGNSGSDSFSTNIPLPQDLCAAPDNWDLSAEASDNSPGNASVHIPGQAPQIHNFCNPEAADRLNDEDWVRFTAAAVQRYFIWARPLTPSSALVFEVYAGDGTTLLAQAGPGDFGQAVGLNWLSPVEAEFYVRLRHADGRVAGDGVQYAFFVSPHNAFLPIQGR